MIAPTAETAELPRVRRVLAQTPTVDEVSVLADAAPVQDGDALPVLTRIESEAGVVADPGPGRRALRQERRLARRQRRIAAALGLAVLAAFVGATVAVLGVVR